MVNSISTKVNNALFNDWNNNVLDKYGWVVLAMPIFIHAIDKSYNLIEKAIDNGYNLHLKVQDFELDLTK